MFTPGLALTLSTLFVTGTALAQQPTTAPDAARRAPNPLQVPNPHYVSIPMSIEVNAPVDRVWARIGKFCDIGDWSGNAGTNICQILSGKEREFGAVRSVGNEVLVGKTKYSYTYAQPPRVGVVYNLYHGTLEAVALSATTTQVNYNLLYDDSTLPDAAARDAYLTNRRTRFTKALANMKVLAEGGALPLLPAPAAATTPAAPFLNPKPHYISIPMTIEVNAPVDKVWARIGKYCDIGEWGIPGCILLSGTDGELGAVRSIGNEVLVGKTRYSYTYTQPLRASGGYIMYHGTLEARPLTSTTTQLDYTLLYDNSPLADDAARETDSTNRRNRFTAMLKNMKTLCEGSALPPLIAAPKR
jgi:hypothetical protein